MTHEYNHYHHVVIPTVDAETPIKGMQHAVLNRLVEIGNQEKIHFFVVYVPFTQSNHKRPFTFLSCFLLFKYYLTVETGDVYQCR